VRLPGALGLLLFGSFGCNLILGLDGLEADRGAGGSGALGSGGDAPTGGSEQGGGGGCSDTCGSVGCGDCPVTNRVAVSAAGGDYLIDAFEVTTLEYTAWLATRPSTQGQGPRCTENDSFIPGEISQFARDAAEALGEPIGDDCTDWLANQSPLDQNKAVACVDWCDAAAYCSWAQGHLCGRIGGGTLDVTSPKQADSNDAELSEWYRACSNAGAQQYPYVGSYAAGSCNDEDSRIEDVGSKPSCVGGFAGIFDMSGNAYEWEDACTNYGNPIGQENCVRRGGGYYSPEVDLACALPEDQQAGTLPGTPADGTGFRCCSL